MILKVLRQIFTLIQACLELSVGDIACYNDGAIEAYTCRNGIFSQFGTHCINAFVKVYFYAFSAFSWLAVSFWYKLRGVVVHLLQPNTVAVYLCLDVSVGRTAYSHAYRAACAMARKANHPDVMSQVFTAELCTESYLMSLIKQLLLQVYITESTAGLIACCRQIVIILNASQLNCEQILFS